MGSIVETGGTRKITETKNGDIGKKTFCVESADIPTLKPYITVGRSRFSDGIPGLAGDDKAQADSLICVNVEKDWVGCGIPGVDTIAPTPYCEIVATYSSNERTEEGKPSESFQGRTELLDLGPGSTWPDGDPMNQPNLIHISKGVYEYRRTVVWDEGVLAVLFPLKNTTNKYTFKYFAAGTLLMGTPDWRKYYSPSLNLYLLDVALSFEYTEYEALGYGWNWIWRAPEKIINGSGIVVYSGTGEWVNVSNYPIADYRNLGVVVI